MQVNAELNRLGALYCRGERLHAEVLAASRVAAAETKASHEVMELVRKDPALSLLVVRLREAGEPWHQVKVAIEAKIKRARQGRRSRQANTSEPQKRDE